MISVGSQAFRSGLKDVHVQQIDVKWRQEKVLEHAADQVPRVKCEQT